MVILMTMIILCFWVVTSIPVTDTMGKRSDEEEENAQLGSGLHH